MQFPFWAPNEERIFEINVPQKIKDITLVSITNKDTNADLCIDSVIINKNISATYLSANTIGGNSGVTSLNAIIKYPVCKTEVIGIKQNQRYYAVIRVYPDGIQ